MPPKLAKVLIVEDHKPLREALARAMSAFSAEVLQADGVLAAEVELEGHPDVVLVDVWLPDGSGQRVVERAVRLRPTPAVIAMSGHASAEEAFDLARAGARRYLAKPIALEDLMRSIDEALADRPDLAPLVAAHVGQTPLREVIDQVRDTMLDEALARTHDAAARRAGVTRQAVQRAARERAHGRLRPSRGSGEQARRAGHRPGARRSGVLGAFAWRIPPS
jgi:DNA-binding response OmpR family regulator